MANPSMQYQSRTGDGFVDSMTTGFSWSLDGSRSLDYSVSNGIYGEYWFDPSSVSQYLGAALSLYAYYANISFSNLGLFSDPIAAANAGSEINVSLDASNLFFSSYNSWAIGFFPNSEFNSLLYEGAAGDIYINVNSGANYLPSYEPGSQGWFLLLHELGHTLGLKHPHDDGGTGRPTFNELGVGELDIDLATVMSYNDDAEWNRFSWDPATPMVLDVLALQYLYGKNQSTNSGSSAHSLNDFIGYYATLWDASGDDDVVSVRDGFDGWLIELPEATISSLSSERIGYAIPSSDLLYSVPTTLIWLVGDLEHVNGSVFSDVVVGNSLDNRVFLDAGDDRFIGGEGLDVIYFDGEFAQFSVTQDSVWNSSITQSQQGWHFLDQSGNEGFDQATGVERAVFSDVTIALDLDGAGGQAYRIYKAAFDREPDSGGLGYWIAQMDQGMSLSDLSAQFINSVEFRDKYGLNPSNEKFITMLYNNVLDRDPDPDGLAWWVEEMDSKPERTPQQVLAEFSESDENQNNVAELIANGIVFDPWVG